MLAELSDKSLMRRFRSGSGDAAAALYERYADRLDYLASRGLGSDMVGLVDSDDVVQSIFRTTESVAARAEKFPSVRQCGPDVSQAIVVTQGRLRIRR